MSDRTASVEITASSRGLQGKLRSARSKFGVFADGVKSTMKDIGKSAVGSFIGNVGANLFGQVQNELMAGAKSSLELERGLTRLQIAAGRTPEEMEAFRASIRAVSDEQGLAQEELLAGAQAYVDLTGDIAGAERATRTFARVAQASGATVSDIAQASAALQQSLGITADELEATFSGMIMQGKAGAVSLKDFARELSSIAPRWAKFNEGSTVKGVAEMGAAFQLARQGFRSASEAATGMEALMGAIQMNAKRFEAVGVKVFDKNPKTGVKTLRSFNDIIQAISNSKLMKDPTALARAMGSKEAAQTFDMLTRNRALWDQLVQAGLDKGAVDRDNTTYLNSSAGQIDKAMTSLKNTVIGIFTPERIEKFAHVLTFALDKAAALVAKLEEIGAFIDDLTDSDVSKGMKAFSTANVGAEAGRRAAALQRLVPTVLQPAVAARLAKQAPRADYESVIDRATGAALLGDLAAPASAQFHAGLAATQARRGIGAARFGKGANAIVNSGVDANVIISLIRASEAMSTLASKPIEVKIDSDTILKAQRKAVGHRSRPGG